MHSCVQIYCSSHTQLHCGVDCVEYLYAEMLRNSLKFEKYELIINRNVLFFVVLVLQCQNNLSFYSCRNCEMHVHTLSVLCARIPIYLPFTHLACTQTCQNGGTLDERTCMCDCTGGFSGANCEGEF